MVAERLLPDPHRMDQKVVMEILQFFLLLHLLLVEVVEPITLFVVQYNVERQEVLVEALEEEMQLKAEALETHRL